jgi:hypothetical protein
MWIRAILERDLSFCKWGQLSGMALSARDESRGVCRNMYPPGLALVQFPIMAPLVNLHTETPPISPAENSASLVCGAVVLALVCWLLLASSYLLGAPPWAANFAVLVFTFGTGLFQYGTCDSCFTHIYSALGISLLVWLWLGSKAKGRPAPPWAFALICFFLMALRNTNLIPILFLLPVCATPQYRTGESKPRGSGWRALPAGWPAGLAALAGVALAISMQVAYNYYATRQFMFSTYGQATFHFDRPMQWPVLFSYERGLFTYYPVLAVGLAAGLWASRTRIATCWLLGLISVFVMMYGFWMSWSLAAGMGHRGFVELMPFAAVIFAAALPELAPRNRIPVMALGTVLAFVTLEIMCGYWATTFPFSGGTQRLFWKNVVGEASLLSFHRHYLPDDAYSALIVPSCLTCPTAPGSPLRVQVTVTNLSERSWPEVGIALSTRFVRAGDGVALSGFDNRFPVGTDFAPHATKQYVIALKSPAHQGDYSLQVDLVRDMVAWFSDKGTKRGELPIHVGSESLPDDAYSVLIAPKCLVCPTAPGSPLSVQVTVSNLSGRSWPEAGIALSMRFVRAGDGVALSGFDNRFPLGTGFAPHESRQYVIELKSPAPQGDYRLEFDLVQELVTWFSNKGTKRGELSIHVRAIQTKAGQSIAPLA